MQPPMQARSPAVQDRLHAILPNGKDTKDITLSAHAIAEAVDAMSTLGSCFLFEEEMEVLLQVCSPTGG